MKLTVKDRIVLLGLMPQQGKFLELLTAKDIQAKVALDAQTRERVELKEIDGGGLTWDVTKDEGLDVEMSGPETALIVKRLQDMDKKGELTPDHLNVCELFGIKG